MAETRKPGRRIAIGKPCPRCGRMLTAKTYREIHRPGRSPLGRCLFCAASKQRVYDQGHKKVAR